MFSPTTLKHWSVVVLSRLKWALDIVSELSAQKLSAKYQRACQHPVRVACDNHLDIRRCCSFRVVLNACYGSYSKVFAYERFVKMETARGPNHLVFDGRALNFAGRGKAPGSLAYVGPATGEVV